MMPALVAHEVSVVFGDQFALNSLGLSVEPGEIRALVGANGSGKSTLVKVLAGLYKPLPGARVSVGKSDLALGTAGAGEHVGLRFVHQDLGLIESLDVLDNLAVGHGYQHLRRGFISWRNEERSAADALLALGYEIDVRRPVGELSISERTAVAIARALSPRRTSARMLILDEPTANLPGSEASRLFALIRRVRENGTAVLFISHHFAEVFAIADSVTVLRDGQHVITERTSALTEDHLIAHVVGRELVRETLLPATSTPERTDRFCVTGLRTQTISGVDLRVGEGEIVGVAGITGSGREDLAGALFGDTDRSGEVSVMNHTVRKLRPDLSIKLGLGLVPADRRFSASFMEASVQENVTTINTSPNVIRGLIRFKRERAEVLGWLEKLNVVPRRPEARFETLSGGNQQKVILARWLRQMPQVLILDDPTQGVDIGAKADIHRLIRQSAAEGTAVLLISTDDAELVALCTRVLVLGQGEIRYELTTNELTTENLTAGTAGALRTNS